MFHYRCFTWLAEDAGITLSVTSLTSYISRIRRHEKANGYPQDPQRWRSRGQKSDLTERRSYMAKSNTNGNGADVTNGCAITPTIHLVLQGKGGVGKTVVAGWLAEFLIHRGQPVHCIDGDPVNRSLAQYKALPVDKLDLVNQDGVVMRSRYDALIDRFLNEEAVFVVDNGATAFLPFWTYVVESNIPWSSAKRDGASMCIFRSAAEKC
jgi:hypothetical protein